ncbi:FHA domain-containing protein [Pseudomonadota bacterium]
MTSVESPEAKARIFLTCGEQTVVYRDGDPSLSIGRAKTCGLVVEESCVSREHAILHVEDGRMALSDQSSTGTWVCVEGRPVVFLSGESRLFTGKGFITLGQEPDMGSASTIFFEFNVED